MMIVCMKPPTQRDAVVVVVVVSLVWGISSVTLVQYSTEHNLHTHRPELKVHYNGVCWCHGDELVMIELNPRHPTTSIVGVLVLVRF